jgi:hypothetical protein
VELLGSSPGPSWVALVAVLVEAMIEVLVFVLAGWVAFSAAAAFVVLAAVLVDGVGTLGSDPVATSAGASLVMPGRLISAYVSHRHLRLGKDCRCW